MTAECGQTKVDTTAELIPLHTLLILYPEEALPRHRLPNLPSPASASLNMINFIKPIKGKTSVLPLYKQICLFMRNFLKLFKF